MTQLYSNLVNYVNSTTYLCLVLAVLWSSVVLRVRLASLHTRQHQWTSGSTKAISCLMSNLQLSKHSPFILITENKGGPTHGLKTKNLFCSTEV